jgi:hypothetical protein
VYSKNTKKPRAKSNGNHNGIKYPALSENLPQEYWQVMQEKQGKTSWRN